MSVHYKFKSALEYDTITFDGLHISVKDLKNAIIQQKRIGKNTDFDLQVTNAQTKEVYEDENTLIPKNTSLLIARIPISAQTKNKQWEGYGGDATPPSKLDECGPISKAVDLSSLDAPEDDKIKAMMSQSTQDYDPSNYMKIRGANQVGAVPPNYRCYKCHQTGHWIKDCPLSKGGEPIEIKKSTGIPLSFMVPVEGPQVPGAMMTPNGSYAVPVLDHQTYSQKQPNPPPPQEPKPEIPEDLLCSICSDLLADAVMIPCCGNSFCDECIRNYLLESEDHECPDCHEKDISPGTLIPNRFLRNSVANFKNTTGYVKKLVYKPKEPVKIIDDKPDMDEKITTTNTEIKKDVEEKTIISEADSTEKNETKEEDVKGVIEEIPKEHKEEPIPEGPPGVSPQESPKGQQITKRVATTREKIVPVRHKTRPKEESPRRPQRNNRSPQYESRQEERPGTPTVDEPGNIGGNTGYQPQDRVYPAAPPTAIPPIINVMPPMGAPPPGYPAQQGIVPFTPNGPPPNYRLPPPATAYMQPGPYTVPPRPIYDSNRGPPIASGPPPIYPNYQSGSRNCHHNNHHHTRDYINDRRIRGRTPSGIIDDPLAAFNRMLREKDERERRKRRRTSYSRSRSRSRSYSPSPRRMRSRSPRRRSRSRSFSISRSRSRSFSGSLRGSPYREFSPRHSPRRRGHSRYRSPIRSPPPRHRYKDNQPDRYRDRDYERDRERDRDRDRERDRDRDRDRERDRDRDRDRERDRDYGRDDRGFSRDRDHRRDFDKHERERDYNNYYDERNKKPKWCPPLSTNQSTMATPTIPPLQSQSQSVPLQQNMVPPSSATRNDFYSNEMPSHYSANRYPPRDYVPPSTTYIKPEIVQTHHLPPPPQSSSTTTRRFDDIAPPGVEEPPVPGLEPSETTNFKQFSPQSSSTTTTTTQNKRKRSSERIIERINTKDKKRSPTPKAKSKEKDINIDDNKKEDKHKRKRHESSEKERKSDDEKIKKSKERKKKKDKKDDKKKRKDKKEKHKDKKHKEDEDVKVETKCEPSKEKDDINKEEKIEEKDEEKPTNLYDDDIFNEDVDTKLVENYGKLDEEQEHKNIVEEEEIKDKLETKELLTNPEPEEFDEINKEEDKDILELHTNELDLKPDDIKNEMLAPLPEKSKWEVDDESSQHNSPKEKSERLSEKKVTNEVLKRAENAIFAKAINAIRPIEIKKISTDRAKLYSGEDIKETVEIEKKVEPPPIKIPIKDRLGVKVDDNNEKIIKNERNKSRSMSPFSKRGHEANRNYGIGERTERKVIEIIDKRRRDERGGDQRRREIRRSPPRRDFNRPRPDYHRRNDRRRDDKRRSRSRPRHFDEKKKISRSRSGSDDRKHKKKDKKGKKEKSKKPEEEKKPIEVKQIIENKRKPTIDEANFEPDYDLETESEKEEKKIEKKIDEKRDAASSSDSSDSSSDDDRKRKKHKKHKKVKKSKKSSSSSDDSDSESSDDDNNKKRKKHKKKQKKRKKSKHK